MPDEKPPEQLNDRTIVNDTAKAMLRPETAAAIDEFSRDLDALVEKLKAKVPGVSGYSVTTAHGGEWGATLLIAGSAGGKELVITPRAMKAAEMSNKAALRNLTLAVHESGRGNGRMVQP